MLQSGLRHISELDLIGEIIRDAQIIEVEAGKTILDAGSPITVVPLALKGIVKVARVDEEVNEIFLYYIEVEQTCVMTLSVFLHEEHSLVWATAETEFDPYNPISSRFILAKPLLKPAQFHYPIEQRTVS